MAFVNMYREVLGAVPTLPTPLAKTLVNRAWADVKRQNLWSFQLYDGPNWITPPTITAGTVTVVQGSDTVTFDATAAAALNAGSTTYSLITQRQFRLALNTIYNITAWDGVSVATLDRPYGESSATAQNYTVYQCYYAAPYEDHRLFISVRNMQQFIDLLLDKTQEQLNQLDPQRSWYYFPTDVVFYQRDSRTTSVTYKKPLYELWGAPQTAFTYQLYGIRDGADLVNNSDELPYAVGEDAVIARAKFYAYEWAEANKGAVPRNTGPDFKFLMGSTMADYMRLFKDYRRRDRETVNNWFAIRHSSLYGKFFSYYNSIGGTAYPGVSFGGQ